MAYQDPRYWLRGDPARYEAYLDKMVAFARRLLADGATVLLCAQTSSDDRVAEDVVRLVGERAARADGSSPTGRSSSRTSRRRSAAATSSSAPATTSP